MGSEIVRAIEAIEAEAWTDLIAAAPRAFAERVGLRVERVGGAVALLAPRIPTTLFNRAIGLGVERPAIEADVDAIVEAYRAAGSPAFWVHASSASRPAALPSWLAARGFRVPERPTWAKVVRGVEPPPAIATSLDVREIGSAHARGFAEVLASAHAMPAAMASWVAELVGRPRWRAYAAFDGDAIVAGGLLYANAPHAWLGLGGTAPTHRRRGAQGAIMARRIADAIAQGCTAITTETGEPVAGEKNPSLDNMYRCGFRLACSRRNYTLTP